MKSYQITTSKSNISRFNYRMILWAIGAKLAKGEYFCSKNYDKMEIRELHTVDF